MKKIFLVLALASSLGGCAAVQKVEAVAGLTITQNQVDGARSAYDGGFLAGLRRYAITPKCLAGQTFLKNQCHDPATLRKLRAADQVVAQDFDSVQANLDAGDNTALVNAWSILTNAINSANTTLAQAGVK
jgi:hypothetical protein